MYMIKQKNNKNIMLLNQNITDRDLNVVFLKPIRVQKHELTNQSLQGICTKYQIKRDSTLVERLGV